MLQALVEKLSRAGYRVSVIEAVALPGSNKAQNSEVPSDAILEVNPWLYSGYSNASMLDYRFRPHVHVDMKLVDS